MSEQYDDIALLLEEQHFRRLFILHKRFQEGGFKYKIYNNFPKPTERIIKCKSNGKKP